MSGEYSSMSYQDNVLCGQCQQDGTRNDGCSYCTDCKLYLCHECSRSHITDCANMQQPCSDQYTRSYTTKRNPKQLNIFKINTNESPKESIVCEELQSEASGKMGQRKNSEKKPRAIRPTSEHSSKRTQNETRRKLSAISKTSSFTVRTSSSRSRNSNKGSQGIIINHVVESQLPNLDFIEDTKETPLFIRSEVTSLRMKSGISFDEDSSLRMKSGVSLSASERTDAIQNSRIGEAPARKTSALSVSFGENHHQIDNEYLKAGLKYTDAIEDSSEHGEDDSIISDNCWTVSELEESGCPVESQLSLNLKPSPLTFNNSRCVEIQNPEQLLLEGKKLAWTERTSFSRRRNYVIRPDTRLVMYKQIHTKTLADPQRCEISDIDCLPDGRVVVCDVNNKRVKLFDVSGTHQSSVDLQDEAFAVTAVSTSTLAVLSGLAKDMLLIITIDLTMAVRKCFQTNVVCRDIASYASNLFLLCLRNYETEIMILSTDGDVAKRIYIGKTSPSPRCIAVNKTSGLIYITDAQEGVLAISRSGTLYLHCNDMATERYHSLACDFGGHLYVSTENPTGVHELSRDGQYLVPLLAWKGGNYARSLCYNSWSNSVIVGFLEGGVLSVCKVVDDSIHVRL